MFKKIMIKINNLLYSIKNKKILLYISSSFCTLTIIYVGYIIYYLNLLKKCQCFNDKNDKNYSNINYLIAIEFMILIINIIGALYYLFLIKGIDFLKYLGKLKFSMKIIFLIVLILIDGYYIFNLYKLYQNIDESCDCTQSWIRYLLFFQVLIMIINIINLILSISFKSLYVK
jgi:hypothetical protein